MSDFHCKRCGACCKCSGNNLRFLPPQFGAIFQPKANGECQHLRNGPNGIYECAIHDTRPNICRVDVMSRERAENLGIGYEYMIKLAEDACILVRSMKNADNSKVQP